MTLVEEVLPETATKKIVVDKESLAQIVEVTGCEDRQKIQAAVSAVCDKNGSYEIGDVIQYLVTQPSAPSSKLVQACATDIENVKDKENEKSIIDLTADVSATEREQLQSAIEQSLRENQGNILGGQISREEQDISRVLEQSLQETKGSSKRRRGAELWFVDPLNPNERRRQGNWPVGLKNVGNTCWFACVIQALYNLPIFRRLVLAFKPPAAPQNARNLEFMLELRSIFALLTRSQRKYIDPSRAVDILKEAFTASSSAEVVDTGQQDVSEFQHKLLEWLEEAFKLDQAQLSDEDQKLLSPVSTSPHTSGEESEQPCRNNPMINLFYGQCVTQGSNNGVRFKNTETFGQFPLQVSGFGDIHESLEANTAQGNIESVSGDACNASGQEQWFTRLPPVLTFELSRFHFNTNMGGPEKIHDELRFPETLYLDRYLECNAWRTRRKRSEVRLLKAQLQALQDRLDKYMNFGSGAKRFPLEDVLQYALEFAQSQGGGGRVGSLADSGPPPLLSPGPSHEPMVLSEETTQPQDVCMESPKSQVSMQTDSPDKIACPTPLSQSQTSSPLAATTPSCCPASTTPAASFTAPTRPLPAGAATTATPSTSSVAAAAALSIDTNTQPAVNSGSINTMATAALGATPTTQSVEATTLVNSDGSKPATPNLVPVHTDSMRVFEDIRGPVSPVGVPAGGGVGVIPSPSKQVRLEAPSPRHVSGAELDTLQTCLRRWRTEVKSDVKELQDSINSLEEKVSNMYAEPLLKQVAYRLHAVFVHEGQAASGHYWAFVYSTARGRWLKYNDISVSEVSWQELCADSYGGGVRGHTNSSAYCLMYVDDSRRKALFQESGSGEATAVEEELPLDLEKLVSADNAAFQQELLKWERRGATATASTSTGGAGEAGCTTTATQVTRTPVPSPRTSQTSSSATPTSPSTPDVAGVRWGIAERHACMFAQRTAKVMDDASRDEVFSSQHKDGVALAFKRMCEGEWRRQIFLCKDCDSKLPHQDTRLDGLIAYCSYAFQPPNEDVIKRILFEQFALPPCLDSSPRATLLVQRADNELQIQQKKALREGHLDEKYRMYQEAYAMFRRVAANFTLGLEALHNSSYKEAVPLLCSASEQNEKLTSSPRSTKCGVSQPLLQLFRRHSILAVNEDLCGQFERAEQLDSVLSCMNELVIPAFGLLSASTHDEDTCAVERMRERWFSFLSSHIEEDSRERLQELFSRMVEPPQDGGSVLRGLLSSTSATIGEVELSARYQAAVVRAFAENHLPGESRDTT